MHINYKDVNKSNKYKNYICLLAASGGNGCQR